MFPRYAVYGAIHAILAVALGAFGAHALDDRLTDKMLATFETGVRYHMYHALGLILIAVLADRVGNSKSMIWAGRLLHIGIVLFSGSLYVLVLTNTTKLGMITPLGGAAFIAGWVLLAVALSKSRVA